MENCCNSLNTKQLSLAESLKSFQKVTLFIILLISFCSFSQDEISKSNGFGFYIYGGVQLPELKNLDNLLKTHNFSSFSNTHFSGGFALYKESNKIVNTIEIFAYNKSKSNEGNFSSLRVFSGSLSLGYKIDFSTDKFALIPSIALNVYQASIKTSSSPTDELNYEQFLSSGNQSEINGLGIGISANVTALYSPFEKWKPFHFGLRAGYNYTTSMKWKASNGKKVNDVPKTEFLGTNVSLLIGLTF
jgi:hypothetical protein